METVAWNLLCKTLAHTIRSILTASLKTEILQRERHRTKIEMNDEKENIQWDLPKNNYEEQTSFTQDEQIRKRQPLRK